MEDNLSSIITMACLIIMSSYFSATETAFSSLNKTRLKALAEKGNRKAMLAHNLSENYDKLISTILIGNNIVNIALSALATVLFVRLYGDIGATVSTIVITVLVLIFGEITPKSIAKDCPETFAMFSAPIIRLLIFVLTPVNYVFSMWKKMLGKLLKINADSKMSQEELLMLVEEVQQDGSIDQSEGELLRNAIEFTDREAGDILTHRVDIAAIDIESTKDEIGRAFCESKFSRLLVYEENIDNVIGVIHQKDFYTGSGITERDIRDIMTPPVFVPGSVKINDLLRLLQKNKSHVAVVLDEFGGTYGIVTMEDILEELVGEIWDEHDEVVDAFLEIAPDLYRVDGSLDIEEFREHFGIKTGEESDMVSVGGWMTEQFGRIPEEGDSFRHGSLLFTVTEIDSHRIAKATVERLPEGEANNGHEDTKND